MRVAVIGTGHVGLVTCASLAAVGHDVSGYDIDEAKVLSLRSGRTPFYEPGLDELLAQGIKQGSLSFSTDVTEVVTGADVVFICVGTPARANGEANLVAVEDAVRAVARHVRAGAAIVEKSTVPAGTADRVKGVLQLERPDIAHRLHFVSNPEFLREGQAVDDAMCPDRILVGAESAEAFAVLRKLYEPLLSNGSRLIETNIATAELSKHACNAFLALKISYANALARICERAGADVVSVTEVMGSDPRIGDQFLRSGLGYGGYCFPKDLVAFQRLASRLGYTFQLLSDVAAINDEAVESVVDKIRHALWNIEGKRIALLGLSFKPGTDDVRFSPALKVAERLLEESAEVVGSDPQAATNARAALPRLEIAPGPYEALRGAHCAVVCTDWPEFRTLDLELVRRLLVYPILIDGRNTFDPQEVSSAGLTYYPVGRPMVEADPQAQSLPAGAIPQPSMVRSSPTPSVGLRQRQQLLASDK
jgi:UDPglucose 6-dehydrogenase